MNNITTFIENFKKASNSEVLIHIFTQGYCYHFAVILHDLFKGDIIYNTTEGHFLLEKNNKYYDITGEVPEPSKFLYWEGIKICEHNLWENLIENCVYKIKE